ncbi:MAG: methyltransferase [Bacteroidia bacterium]
MIDAIQKQFADSILKPYLKWYLTRPRVYNYDRLKLKIYPGVFHPGYFFSTMYFISFLKELVLKNKRFCEVGSGSGLVSLLACQSGADVTAIELSDSAVEGLKENISNNSLSFEKIKVIKSDLFDSVPTQKFDIVFINPPYFFKEISDESSLAWNCGKNGNYFEKLFLQLPGFVTDETDVYMTLAENCEISKIQDIAVRNGQELVCIREKKIKWEKNFIFKVKTR